MTHSALKLFAKTPPKAICILRLSAIGDTVHTLAVVKHLQANWPNTAITWIIGKLEAQLLGDIPNIEFLIVDKQGNNDSQQAFFADLQKRQFDCLLHMQVSLRASRIARKINAPIKLGFDFARAKDFQWLFSTHRIAKQPQQHVMDGLFGFAQAFGLPLPDKPTWDIPIPTDAQQFAAAYKKALVISPCSSQRSNNFRNWPAERYAEIADYAADHYNLTVVLTGGPTELEQHYGSEITRLMNAEPLNLIGQTSLKQLAAVLQQAQIVVSPDSGPAHIANALGTAVIGLYATSNPDRTGPYDRTYTVNQYPAAVEHFLNKPVSKLKWGQRVRHLDAMDLINVEHVTQKIDRVMAATTA